MSTEIKDQQKKLRQKEPGGMPVPEPTPDDLLEKAPLVGFGERVTYTFVYSKEVGSIHFDRIRGEIFYKGHNIRHMELKEHHTQLLEKMRLILQNDPHYRRFAEPYGRILDKIILEISRERS